MRRFLAICLCLLLLPACDPAVEQEDLGTVLPRLPDVPGATGPYSVPGFESEEPPPAAPQTDDAPPGGSTATPDAQP